MLHKSLTNLIAYYIQRQTIVVLAILDLAPPLLKMGGDSILGIELQPYIDRFYEKQALIENPADLYQGVWKHEWKYRLHGIGCKLVHVRSGEPLEWDAPDPKAFRFDWFWEHLLWRCQFDDDPYVAVVKNWATTASLFQIEPELEQQGIIQVGIDGMCLTKTST